MDHLFPSSLVTPETSCALSSVSETTELHQSDDNGAELNVAYSDDGSVASDSGQTEIAEASAYSDQISAVLDHDDTETWSLF